MFAQSLGKFGHGPRPIPVFQRAARVLDLGITEGPSRSRCGYQFGVGEDSKGLGNRARKIKDRAYHSQDMYLIKVRVIRRCVPTCRPRYERPCTVVCRVQSFGKRGG